MPGPWGLSHLRKVETVSPWHVFAASCWSLGHFLGTRTVETMSAEHIHPGESRHLLTELPTYTILRAQIRHLHPMYGLLDALSTYIYTQKCVYIYTYNIIRSI